MKGRKNPNVVADAVIHYLNRKTKRNSRKKRPVPSEDQAPITRWTDR